MSLVSLGDLAHSFLLKSQTARLKGEAGRMTQELASGRVADVGAALSGDLSRLASESRARSVTAGYQSAAREAATQASATQAAIATISETAQGLVSPLFVASQLNSAEHFSLTRADARGRLDTVMATLNTTIGGRGLFSGQAVQGTALVSADTLLTALRTEISGAATAEEAMSRISSWFDAPAGYSAIAFQGGPPLADVAVSEVDRVWLGVTAEDPAIMELLKGLTAAALIHDSASALSPSQSKGLARLSAETLVAGQDRMTSLAARLGVSEARIDVAKSRNAADLLTHEMAQADLIRSDPKRLAMELEAVQSSLETVYAITARLSRLTLTDFLR